MLAGENVKVKVRAYKNTNTGREYGKYSKTLKFKTKKLYTKIYKNAQCKNFYSKFASEDAFVIQNQYRTAKGRKRLIWSDKLYDIAVLRCKMMATKDGLTHTGISRDQNTILKQYGITTAEERRKLDLRGENIASFYPTPKTVMMAWKKSKGHYDNILNNDWTSGAIGVYFCKEGQGKWCADFSGVNYDEVLENLIIEK